MSVSEPFIRRPIATSLLGIALMIGGALGYWALPVSALPQVDFPTVQVSTQLPGASPDVVASLITAPLERQLGQIPSLSSMNSTSSFGVSQISLQFDLNRDIDGATQDVQAAINAAAGILPKSLPYPPVYAKVNPADAPVMTLALTSDTISLRAMSDLADTILGQRLSQISGVGRVSILGGLKPAVRVQADLARLAAYGIAMEDLRNAIAGANVSGPKGSLDGAQQSYTIAANDQIAAADAYRPIIIAYRNGSPVTIGDVAQIVDGLENDRTGGWYQGTPAVIIDIQRQPGANVIDVVKQIRDEIPRLQRAVPAGVKLTVVSDRTVTIRASVRDVQFTLVLSVVLVTLVVLLFLRSLRATLIAGVALPLSLITSFGIMYFAGFSLDNLSLMALTIGTGFVVDDAIVMIENIVRHMRMGKTPYRAALEAADEIGLAVIAISLTIIAIFAPASFMSGIAGQFFKQFGITVSVQVFFSLLAARFVTPMLAAYFLKHHDHDDPPPGRILRSYHSLVAWSVKHHYVTVLIGFAVFAASIWSITLLPQGFLPAQDTARSLLAMELPPGSQLAYTEKVTEEIVARLRKRPEVRSVFVDGGRVPPGIQEVRRAALIINYTPKADRKITQRELELSISKELDNVPDIRFWFLDENGLRAISLVVTGTDSNIVNNVASELATQMKRIPIIANVISETALDRPELRIRPRAELAARLGVSTESLSQTIRVATIGDVGPALAKFDAGDRQVPIRVQLEDNARSDLQMLEQLRVPLGLRGERGGVPLSVVADIQLDQGPTSINRYDRERQATVAADLVGNAALGDATRLIYDLPVMKSLPKGVKVSPSGDAESLAELSDGFATAITAGLMMVYAVLVLLFGTFLQPITILFSLPLSIGGAIGALLLTGKQLTTPVWIGILMLMGIVTKNAIMLVEFAVEAIRDGKAREEAMIDAGMKRARPIVMTTIAMAAGMMPSALAFGAGGEFRSPMALAVIGGLIFSTVLSLVFVPAMFMVMDDIGGLIWRFGKRLVVSHADHELTPSEPNADESKRQGGPPSVISPAAE